LHRKLPPTIVKNPVLSPVKKRGAGHPWKYAEPLEFINKYLLHSKTLQPWAGLPVHDFAPI